MSAAERRRPRSLVPFCLMLAALASGTSFGSSPLLKGLPSPFFGIAPQDEGHYAAEVISCRDGSKSFRRDRLNDGFCDCPDGTDEPGTSACPESKFYCRNIGDTPVILFSSRVNDRICDCCDGSDEYDGSTSCPNTCSKNEDIFGGSTIKGSKWTKSPQLNAEENKKRVDLEDLVLRLKELRIAVFLEFFLAACVITSCLFHRRARSRRRHHWFRNYFAGALSLHVVVNQEKPVLMESRT